MRPIVLNMLLIESTWQEETTNYLQKLLTECNIYLQSTSEMEIVRKIKENACYIALDFEQESKNLQEKKIQYTLPDNSVIELGDQAIRCPELLFDPSLDGKDIKGIHEYIIVLMNTFNVLSIQRRVK